MIVVTRPSRVHSFSGIGSPGSQPPARPRRSGVRRSSGRELSVTVLTRQQGRHQVAVVRRLPGIDDRLVTVVDAQLDHADPAHPQGVLTRSGEVGVDFDAVLVRISCLRQTSRIGPATGRLRGGRSGCHGCSPMPAPTGLTGADPPSRARRLRNRPRFVTSSSLGDWVEPMSSQGRRVGRDPRACIRASNWTRPSSRRRCRRSLTVDFAQPRTSASSSRVGGSPVRRFQSATASKSRRSSGAGLFLSGSPWARMSTIEHVFAPKSRRPIYGTAPVAPLAWGP